MVYLFLQQCFMYQNIMLYINKLCKKVRFHFFHFFHEKIKKMKKLLIKLIKMENKKLTLPIEIIMIINQFSDDTSKYKIHSLLNYKVCCSYEKQIINKKRAKYDFDNEQFYFCNICMLVLL